VRVIAGGGGATSIGQVIQAARRASGLSQRDVGSISGLAQPTVSDVEHPPAPRRDR